MKIEQDKNSKINEQNKMKVIVVKTGKEQNEETRWTVKLENMKANLTQKVKVINSKICG